ncbi:MAG: 3-dehydroquinate dehydratase [Rhodobacteraceae bacterium CG17_big_fil_post_rev_8_21_14_2_50_63_15]|nr:DUF2478 domain-containing protein [Roseovarius sp.]PIV79157.1 MAG: 3-dehydroquinate dehydratase [Rhodobacteraceae bacterium CG17_big_fil_post_rev_8_21_14_2_50_63_15]
MKIAYSSVTGTGAIDHLMWRVAQRLAAMGLRTCGVVQINTERPQAALCDMDMQVLPDGPVLRISQRLGPGARGCRLEPAGLEEAAGLVVAGLTQGPDVLIVNKFGKHEAEGRGFRPVIAEAMSLNVPVLVGVGGSNLTAFLDFVGDMAEVLPPEEEALLGWVARCHSEMRSGRA